MNDTSHHDERIAKMIFASVYPHYVTKVEKKGRTIKELHRVIEWLTGYDEKKLQQLIKEKVTFEVFFQNASINPNAQLIIDRLLDWDFNLDKHSEQATIYQVLMYIIVRKLVIDELKES